MLILKELLPTAYKHVYLASSRAEEMDKAIKRLRFFKRQGKQMASLWRSIGKYNSLYRHSKWRNEIF